MGVSLASYASLWHGIKILNYVAIMNKFAYLMKTLPFYFVNYQRIGMWDREKDYFPHFGVLLQQFILNCCCVKDWVWGECRGRAPALSCEWLCLLVLHQIPCAIILISPSLVHMRLLYHVSFFKDFGRQSLLGQEQLTKLEAQVYC